MQKNDVEFIVNRQSIHDAGQCRDLLWGGIYMNPPAVHGDHPSRTAKAVTASAPAVRQQAAPRIFSDPASGFELVMIVIDGKPWFVAGGAAKTLGYRDAEKMVRNLADDEKGTHNVGTLGGSQEVTIISEPGLYAAILKSRRPEAEKFQRWVNHVVLPSIRAHGAYIEPGAVVKSPELSRMDILKLAMQAESENQELRAINTDQAVTINALARQFSHGVTPPDFCKQLHGVNTQQVNNFLVERGFLRRERGRLRVNRTERAKRYFSESQSTHVSQHTGEQVTAYRIRVTGDGARLLYRYYLRDELPMVVGWDGEISPMPALMNRDEFSE